MDKENENKILINQIKNHFLFPALKLLIEKCDMATQTLDPIYMNIDDLFELLEKIEKENKNNNNEDEIDLFMYNVIFILRVHLIELSKLKSLVDRFKVTYCGQLKKQFAKESENSSPRESEDENESINQDFTFQLQLNQMQYLFPFATVDQLTQVLCKNNLKIDR